MFAFTEQSKKKKLLKKHTELCKELTRSIIPNNGSEASDLHIKGVRIEVSKLSILYDALKVTYNDWNTIKSASDMWKLDKPAKSEGSLFHAGRHSRHTHLQRTYEVMLYSVPSAVKNTYPMNEPSMTLVEDYVYSAFYAKTLRKLLTRAKSGLLSNCNASSKLLLNCDNIISYTMDQEFICISSSEVPSSDHKALALIAKHTNTNIVLYDS